MSLKAVAQYADKHPILTGIVLFFASVDCLRIVNAAVTGKSLEDHVRDALATSSATPPTTAPKP